jgi:hypothetical protein
MSIEKGPSRVIIQSDFLQFLAIYLISSKFRYTIGKTMKNAIISDIFVGQAQGVVQKRFKKRQFSGANISRSKA